MWEGREAFLVNSGNTLRPAHIPVADRRDRKKSPRVPQRGRNYLITSAWMA